MAFPRVVAGQQIRCSVLYRDGENNPVDPDEYGSLDATAAEPYANIYNPSEQLLLYIGPNSITRDDVGYFYYDYSVLSDADVGVYRITWFGHVDGVPITYHDYFQVTATPTAISDTLINRIKRELKDLSEELDDTEYSDVQNDAEGDVMDVSPYGLAWHNKWEILWLTKRGVRHSLQRIVNNWLTKFSIGKGGKSLALDQPARAIMQRIQQIDSEFDKAKSTRWWDGVHWTYRDDKTGVASSVQVMDYQVDPFTGYDTTPQYEPDGSVSYHYDDEDPWSEY
jgi:hypothetical protein